MYLFYVKVRESLSREFCENHCEKVFERYLLGKLLKLKAYCACYCNASQNKIHCRGWAQHILEEIPGVPYKEPAFFDRFEVYIMT